MFPLNGSDLPCKTTFDKILIFLLGGYPHIQAIVATVSFYVAHIVLYVICIVRGFKMRYHPMIVSELAIEPTAGSIYQSILLITLISVIIFRLGYAVINQRYMQVQRFLKNSKLNKVAFFLGIYCQIHMPLIFMFPYDDWPMAHQIIAFTFFVTMTIYVALHTHFTRVIVRKHPTIIKRSRIFISAKIGIVTLSVIFTVIQIALLVYKNKSAYATDYAKPQWKWLSILASVFEWLHILSLILGVLMFTFEMKPCQLSPIQQNNAGNTIEIN